MSAPLAGKFQDHYEVLGVEPNAELGTIQRVHSELSQKFHPSNRETGNAEKLEAVELAYEVLSQPDLRRDYDRVKGVGEEHSAPKFSGVEFFDAFDREVGLRLALLCVLYDRRRSKPVAPSLSMRHIENILAATSDQMMSVLWYLKQRGMVASDDKSSLQITVEGMDYLETNRPSPQSVMPWIKASGTGSAAVAAPAPPPSALTALHTALAETPTVVPDKPSAEDESRRSVVNRILARSSS
jgi:curved DNA-binding protein CbpA